MSAFLYTAGYEGTVIDEFVHRLIRERIETVIDVRELPLSRKKGFSKNSFSEILAKVGISYVHMKLLGDPREGRLAAREGRVRDFERIFLRHLKAGPSQEAILQSIKIAKNSRSCLVCFERDHSKCHRHFVAEAMVSKSNLKVRHLSVSSLVPNRDQISIGTKNDSHAIRYRAI